MPIHRAASRPDVPALALAAALVPVLLLLGIVGASNDGFPGGFAIGLALVLAVVMTILVRRGLAARRG